MYKRTASVSKGILIGMAAGAAATVIGSHMITTNRKAIRKNANKALQAVNSFVDSMDCMLHK